LRAIAEVVGGDQGAGVENLHPGPDSGNIKVRGRERDDRLRVRGWPVAEDLCRTYRQTEGELFGDNPGMLDQGYGTNSGLSLIA